MIFLANILTLAFLNILTIGISPSIRIFNVAPLFPLFFLIFLACKRKGFEPIFLAAFSGFLLDIYSAYPFGVYLLLFLATAAAIKVFFGEGMNELRFLHYFYFILVGLAAFLMYQFIYLYTKEVVFLTEDVLKTVIGYLSVNLAWGTLFYFFGNWYFDKLIVLHDYLKRR